MITGVNPAIKYKADISGWMSFDVCSSKSSAVMLLTPFHFVQRKKISEYSVFSRDLLHISLFQKALKISSLLIKAYQWIIFSISTNTENRFRHFTLLSY